jgi:uncharacterized protein YggE
VTASRASSNTQPEQAVFNVTVGSGLDTTLDQVVAALSGSGITAANLVGISGQSTSPTDTNPTTTTTTCSYQSCSPLAWTFQLTAQLSKLGATTAALTSLQNTIAQKKNGLSLGFGLQYTQVSPQPTQNCDFASLLADARTQAQKEAGPAGLSVGAIVGITGFVTESLPACSVGVTFALGLMLGQPGPNPIAITASRTSSPQLDQVLFGITVNSGLSAGLDDITGALQAAGISGAIFSNVSTSASTAWSVGSLQWWFTLTAPLTKLNATLAQLGAAQQTIANKNSGLGLTFSVSGPQPSPQVQESQACSQAGLLVDAQAMAQKVAAAAGTSAGAILSISDGSGYPAGIGGAVFAGQVIGFSQYSLVQNAWTTPRASLPPCSQTFQFQLGG